MKTVCARLWQAEAVEDGRLVGGERASFESHAVDCPECANKLAALGRLRQVCAELPVVPEKPFEKRRRREALLARADARQRGRHERRWWPVGLGLVAAAAALVVFVATRPAPIEKLTPVAVAPSYALEPSVDGAWHVVETGATTRVAIDAGEVAVKVGALAPAQRFVVELPDGELEVVDTHFVVAADGTTTRRVVVHSGQVILRLDGQGERVLHAGESYVAPEPVVVPAPVRVEPAPVAPAPRREPEAPPVTEPPPPAPSAPTAGEELAAAMDAFASGDFGRAETLFAAFEEHHPADTRVEDAAYLRIVARARRGDAAGARALAREYLQKYPDGFRRREAEGLAGSP